MATTAGVERCFRQLEGGGLRALEELKAAGEIKGFGAGINDGPMIGRFLDRCALDFFLVAMPYTLLDQAPLDDGLPRCAERGIGIVIGSPYASGILATGAVEGAQVQLRARRRPRSWRRPAGSRRSAARHGVPLAAAALQFPLGHPAVAALIPGAVAPAEVERNLAHFRGPIPAGLWADLKADGLIHPAAPVPA